MIYKEIVKKAASKDKKAAKVNEMKKDDDVTSVKPDEKPEEPNLKILD